jgi:hypothetical protein
MDVTKEMYCICINKYLMEIQIQIDCYSLGSSYYHDYDEIKQNQAHSHSLIKVGNEILLNKMYIYCL